MGASAGSAGLIAPVLVVIAFIIVLVTSVIARVFSPRRHSHGTAGPPGAPRVAGRGEPSSPAQRVAGPAGVVMTVVILFLFPWAAVVGASPLAVLLEMTVVLTIVGAGLAYAWWRSASR